MEVSARAVTLPLAETFTISRGSQDEAELVEVEIRHGGRLGLRRGGADRALRRVGRLRRSRGSRRVELGDDPWALDEIDDALPPGEHAARAAVDAALHDLQGKLAGVPVYRLLGLRRDGPPTSWTVWLGDPDDMARRAERGRARGFRRLKLKLGGRDGLDLERVQRRPRRDRPAAPGRRERVLDARRGARAAPADAARVLRAAAAGRRSRRARAEARARRSRSTSTRTATRSPTSRRAPSARTGSTIKLAKSGGIREAVRMAHAARALGLGVMLGCMVESGLGIAAGAQIASLCDHVDLDGNLLLARRPVARC